MLDLRSVRSRAMLATAVLAAMAAGPAAWAQEDEEPEPEKPRRAVAAARELWAFGTTRAEAEARLEARLTMEVDRIARSCRLAEAQEKKLQLAGRGDIKRFLDRVDAVREAPSPLHPVGNGPPAVPHEDEMQSLQKQLTVELPLKGPLFAKMLPRALDTDQAASYRAGRRESRRFLHRALVDLAVDVYDVAAGCSDEQRERLTKLFIEQTRLPASAGEEFLIVLAQVTQLPESRLRPLFDDAQWRAVARLLAALKPELKNQLDKAVFEPDDAAGPIAAQAPDQASPRSAGMPSKRPSR